MVTISDFFGQEGFFGELPPKSLDWTRVSELKAVYAELRKSNPNRSITVPASSISEQQIGYIRDFLRTERDYRSSHDNTSPDYITKVASFEAYRAKLARRPGEDLTLWLFENGFDLIKSYT